MRSKTIGSDLPIIGHTELKHGNITPEGHIELSEEMRQPWTKND